MNKKGKEGIKVGGTMPELVNRMDENGSGNGQTHKANLAENGDFALVVLGA